MSDSIESRYRQPSRGGDTTARRLEPLHPVAQQVRRVPPLFALHERLLADGGSAIPLPVHLSDTA